MALLLWDESYSVGVESLDADHIMIASLINHIDDAKQAASPERVIGALVRALIRQAETHFRREERMMESCAYPLAEKHRQQHAMVEEQLLELYESYMRTPDPDTSLEIMQLLNFWLIEHILKVDMHYKGMIHDAQS